MWVRLQRCGKHSSPAVCECKGVWGMLICCCLLTYAMSFVSRNGETHLFFPTLQLANTPVQIQCDSRDRADARDKQGYSRQGRRLVHQRSVIFQPRGSFVREPMEPCPWFVLELPHNIEKYYSLSNRVPTVRAGRCWGRGGCREDLLNNPKPTHSQLDTHDQPAIPAEQQTP
ncbi:hypothetical protein EDB86DRAFT_171898 [Lactarius hatsudake]|nr:hypothetical protein EDB86DRAFT_171898 [Lactarius hatsudake]